MVYHVKPLRGDGNDIICVKLRRYNAHPITLGDGSEIKAGDRIIELHLNNAWFKKRRKLNLKASRLTWEGLHCVTQDLSFLAEQIAREPLNKPSKICLSSQNLLIVCFKRLNYVF